jgi:proton-dependent oligopeptide transporter, POT family
MLFALGVFTIFRKTVASGELSAEERANQATTHTIKLTHKQERDRIVALLTIFAVVVVFWMVFEQNGFTLTFWARDNTETTISPEIFQSVNPVFILIFTPLLVGFWNILRKAGKEPATATKIALGMLLTAAAYGVMTLAGWTGGDHGRVGVSWLVGTYGVITLAELLLSPMGLSLVSRLAPPRMAGMLMGTWFAFTALGSYLAGLIGGFWDKMNHSTFFAILAIASLGAFFVLLMVIRKLHGTISEAEQMERELAQGA